MHQGCRDDVKELAAILSKPHFKVKPGCTIMMLKAHSCLSQFISSTKIDVLQYQKFLFLFVFVKHC